MTYVAICHGFNTKVSKKDVSRIFSLRLEMMQQCARSLCQQGVGTSAAIANPQGRLQLEVDNLDSLVPIASSQQGRSSFATSPDTLPAFDGQVFFKPVDGNLAHQTFLGEGFRSDFECLGQIMTIVRTDRDTNNKLREVFLGPSTGEPKALTLPKLSFEQLPCSLKIWECGETGYDVQREMLLGFIDFINTFGHLSKNN